MVEILRYTQNLSSEICAERFVWCANSLHASDMRPIGEVIRELRKAKGMTLEDLAAEAGTDSGNLSRLERGLQGYTQERLEVIARGLGISVADLWLEAIGAERVTQKERAMLKKFRLMPDEKQDALQKIIDPVPSGESGKEEINQPTPPAKSA
jgi:transcriptional regulator with XRE-family HTH domain